MDRNQINQTVYEAPHGACNPVGDKQQGQQLGAGIIDPDSFRGNVHPDSNCILLLFPRTREWKSHQVCWS